MKTGEVCDRPLDSFGYKAHPCARMVCAISSQHCTHSAASCASTITRTSGSVPLSRTSTRPVSPSFYSAARIASCTFASACAAFLSFTRTLISFCG